MSAKNKLEELYAQKMADRMTSAESSGSRPIFKLTEVKRDKGGGPGGSIQCCIR
jgi:hypothetical protein